MLVPPTWQIQKIPVSGNIGFGFIVDCFFVVFWIQDIIFAGSICLHHLYLRSAVGICVRVWESN